MVWWWWWSDWSLISSDVKRGQNVEAKAEAEARTLRLRPRSRPATCRYFLNKNTWRQCQEHIMNLCLTFECLTTSLWWMLNYTTTKWIQTILFCTAWHIFRGHVNKTEARPRPKLMLEAEANLSRPRQESFYRLDRAALTFADARSLCGS